MPIVIVGLGVLFLLILIIFFRLNSFIALIIVSMAVGLAQGMAMESIIQSIQQGIGGTLGFLTLILGFGAMLGKLVADSGAAQKIAHQLIDIFGKKHLQWAAVLTGFIVGIPMFYTVGFVVLVPLIFTIAMASGLPLLYVGLPMLAALSVTHGYLPPHPGPTAIAVLYKADFGMTLLYGIIVAIPAIILAGPIFSKTLTKYKTNPPAELLGKKALEKHEMPGFSISVFTGLLPVFLIGMGTLAPLIFEESSSILPLFATLGDPVMAMLISVLVAIYTLGIRRGRTMKSLMKTIESSIGGIAMILLIIGAAGAFMQILIDSGVSIYITEQVTDLSFSPLVLAWGIAALLRVSLGSATVAGLTTAGIVLPVVTTTGVSPELMVLATGAGSLMFSHVNDPGFWMFKEFFGLTIRDTITSWSIMETIVSVVGLLGVLLLNTFI